MRKINKIIIHCSDSEFGDASDIDQWHKERGWSKIGYHFVVLNGYHDKGKLTEADDGFIELGRDPQQQGAHTQWHNANSIGICMIGKHDFTEKQFKSLANLLRGLLIQYKLKIDDIYGHKDFSHKTCPNFDIDIFKTNYLLKDN